MAALSVAAVVILKLQQAIQTSNHTLRLRDRQDNVRQLELDIFASLQKLQAWQKTWSGNERHPHVSAQALWGVNGWTQIRRMLEVINDTSQKIADYLGNLKANEENKPRSRWQKAYKAIQAKHGPSSDMQQLQIWSTTLTRSVDELWIYSETVFDSRYGTLESMVPERDRLLHTALRSRPCSLELYFLCLGSTFNCSLEMDLLDSDLTNLKGPSTPSEASLTVFYHILTSSGENHSSLEKMTIERVETNATLKPDPGDVVIQKMENLQLRKLTAEHKTAVVEVAARGSTQSSCLRFAHASTPPVDRRSVPESLDKVLDRLQSVDRSTREFLSISAKIELAYKVIECGFFLLGTPWFASLSSRNVLRVKNTEKAHDMFYLGTQTLDLEDLLYEDPTALAETSQLFRLGVLLMEIALGKPVLYSGSDDTGQEADRISKLPFIEKSMGSSYCRATAFCLQYRQSGKPFRGGNYSKGRKSGNGDRPFREVEKYEDPNFDDWQNYLAELLQQYHSQVYLRVQALREFAGDPEPKSTRLLKAPTEGKDDD